jgi:hypothetical protein
MAYALFRPIPHPLEPACPFVVDPHRCFVPALAVLAPPECGNPARHPTLAWPFPLSHTFRAAAYRVNVTVKALPWRRSCCTKRVVSSKRPRKETRIRWLLASVLAALWLFTGFAATSSELHHCLHKDASSGEHQCLFTKYAEGQFVNAPTAQITLQIPLCLSAVCPPPAVVKLPSLIRLLPPERAPPVL